MAEWTSQRAILSLFAPIDFRNHVHIESIVRRRGCHVYPVARSISRRSATDNDEHTRKSDVILDGIVQMSSRFFSLSLSLVYAINFSIVFLCIIQSLARPEWNVVVYR